MTNKTVLIVEDEPDIRLGLLIDLEAHGHYTVWEAGDRQEALLVLEKRGQPHVIITDIMMPSSKTAGLELIADIRANPQWKYLPIIVLSARIGTQEILEALKRGANDYLVKPCDLEDMLQRVGRAYELSCELVKPSSAASPDLPSEPISDARKLHVDTLKLALWYWELTTQRTKFDLAEESKLWTTYVNAKGSYSTRTLDKYLHEASLPANPRTHLIISTATFVLQSCPEEPSLKPQLEEYIQELSQLAS